METDPDCLNDEDSYVELLFYPLAHPLGRHDPQELDRYREYRYVLAGIGGLEARHADDQVPDLKNNFVHLIYGWIIIWLRVTHMRVILKLSAQVLNVWYDDLIHTTSGHPVHWAYNSQTTSITYLSIGISIFISNGGSCFIGGLSPPNPGSGPPPLERGSWTTQKYIFQKAWHDN